MQQNPVQLSTQTCVIKESATSKTHQSWDRIHRSISEVTRTDVTKEMKWQICQMPFIMILLPNAWIISKGSAFLGTRIHMHTRELLYVKHFLFMWLGQTVKPCECKQLWKLEICQASLRVPILAFVPILFYLIFAFVPILFYSIFWPTGIAK